jgi:hypothetical protein
MTRLYSYIIDDILGDPRKYVFCEVECETVRLYPGSREEPADFAVNVIRLSLNDAELDPAKHQRLVTHIMENGGERS